MLDEGHAAETAVEAATVTMGYLGFLKLDVFPWRHSKPVSLIPMSITALSLEDQRRALGPIIPPPPRRMEKIDIFLDKRKTKQF